MWNNKEILDYLKQQDFVPSKKMGQNFLLNDKTRQKIISKANVTTQDKVLEIGPGLGALTCYLNDNCHHVIAIELDKRLFSFLTSKQLDHTLLINNDILKVNLEELFKQNDFIRGVKVVANLPYSISSLIIIKLLQLQQVSEINILVQKEMAQRLLAKPNTKDYNAFTILVQLYANIEHLMSVSKNDFYPKPNVDSWFIRINKKVVDYKFTYQAIDKFLKIAFTSRRKKLINNLQRNYNKQKVIDSFNELNISLNIRPEELTCDDFVALYNLLHEGNNENY